MKPAPAVQVRSPLVAASLARAARGRGVAASAFGWFGKRSEGAGASSTATLAMPPPRTARASLPSPTAPTTAGSSSSPPTPTRRSTRPTARAARFDPGTTSACLPPPCPTPASPSTPRHGGQPRHPRVRRPVRTFRAILLRRRGRPPRHGDVGHPYALSIMGQRQVSNCPFGNGNGYGDGRAVSVGEVIGTRAGDGGDPTAPQRWEMQLKGGGPTFAAAPTAARYSDPPSASFSPPRMHALGVSTTRALSLVVSEGGDEVRRRGTAPRRTRRTTRPRFPSTTCASRRIRRRDQARIVRQAANACGIRTR